MLLGQIFEMSAFTGDEVGAALTITPNGARILRSWGFDATAARVTEVLSMRLVDAQTLTPALTEDLEGVEAEFGAKLASYHRADLHNQLKYMATRDNNHQPGIPARLFLGSSVISVDCETGEIWLGNGLAKKKDLVVISDGIRSNFIRNITGKDEPLMDFGWSMYRLTIPMYDLMRHSNIRRHFDTDKPGFWAPFDTAKAFYMMTYPCKSGRLLNIVLRYTTQPGENTASNWDATASKEDVVSCVSEYHPSIGEIISKARKVKSFKLSVREPLETFNRGRAVLIGDAAHTIMPTHAQGAVLAIEEAAALHKLFNGVHSRESVGPRLGLYTKVLKKHIHMVQYLSNALPEGGDENRRKAEELWGEGLYPRGEYGFSKPVREFFYHYDVQAEMEKAMAEVMPEATSALEWKN